MSKRRHFEHVPQPGLGARVACYLRYSNPKQNGITLEKQQRLCEEFATAHGWTISAYYTEPETTAKEDDIEARPQFARLLRDAQAGTFAAIIVESVDRWGRSAAAFYTSLSLLDKANVYWSTVVAPIYDSQTIVQEGTDLAFGISVGMAAAYSRITSRKVVAGMQTQALKGYHHSMLPYGYTRSEPEFDAHGRMLRRHMVPDPATFPQLAIIAELRIKGWGSMAIGEVVGLPPSRINRILANETYVAFRPDGDRGTVITSDGTRVEGLHQAAWSAETWARIRQMTAQLMGRPRAAAAWRRAFPLAGLLLCADCGYRKYARTKHGAQSQGGRVYRYYDCYDHDRPKCPSGKTAVPCAIIEDAFGHVLAQLGTRDDWTTALASYLDEALPEQPTQPERATLERQLAALDVKLDVGRITPAAYKQQVTNIQEQLRALALQHGADKREAAVAAAASIRDMATSWRYADAEERQQMATLLIQPQGLIWHQATQAFIGIKAFTEFVPGFAVALGWEEHEGWLRQPETTGEAR